MVIPYFLIQLFGIFYKVHLPWLKVILRNEQEVDIIVSWKYHDSASSVLCLKMTAKIVVIMGFDQIFALPMVLILRKTP